MNAIAIIAGIGILYLLTRQTPGGPPAVSTNAPNSIAIGEPNPSTPDSTPLLGTGRDPIGGGDLHGYGLWFGSGQAFQTGYSGPTYRDTHPYAPGVIRVEPPENE